MLPYLKTREWLDEIDPITHEKKCFISLLMSCEFYRGTQGTEVAFLIRMLLMSGFENQTVPSLDFVNCFIGWARSKV